jgi:hypothetical protein
MPIRGERHGQSENAAFSGHFQRKSELDRLRLTDGRRQDGNNRRRADSMDDQFALAEFAVCGRAIERSSLTNLWCLRSQETRGSWGSLEALASRLLASDSKG